MGVSHFKNLFKAPLEATIAEVIQVAQVFPRFMDEDDNETLMGLIIMLDPYNTSGYPITIVFISLINIVVPLLSPYCYCCAP